MAKGILITEEGKISRVEINDLEDMQMACKGFVEPIRLNDCEGLVNEEGLLLNLPYNPVATSVAREVGYYIGPIVGPLLILGPIVNGDYTDAPEVEGL